MKRVIHHLKRHSKNVHSHLKDHHKKYIFGLISAALLYKVFSLIIATLFVNQVSYMGYSYADDIQDPTDPETEITEEFDGEDEGTAGGEDEGTAGGEDEGVTGGEDEGTAGGEDEGVTGGEDEGIDGGEDEGVTGGEDEFINLSELIMFSDVSNSDINIEYFSNTITLPSIINEIVISINNGMYKINDQERTGSNGLVNSGDTIQLKSFSPSNYGETKVTTISLGDEDFFWNINTRSTNGICDSQDLNVIKPLSGDILKGDVNIERSYNNTDCSGSEFLIKLRDANTQYITVGTANYLSTGITFDSTLLYSGFYNITGLNSTGDEVVVYTGQYSGLNTKYFSGHKIVIYNSDLDVLYEGDNFTIDNENPTIENIIIDFDPINSGYVGLGADIVVSFDSSEELSGLVVNILGIDAILQNKSGNSYEYSTVLSNEHTPGSIIYNIEFEDLAGNTGYVEDSLDIIFDKTNPIITNFDLDYNGGIMSLSFDIDGYSMVDFAYILSGENNGSSYQSNYTTNYLHSFSGLTSQEYYNYSLSIKDLAENVSYIGGYFKISGDILDYDYSTLDSGSMIVSLGFNSTGDNTNTGDLNTGSFVSILNNEISNFNTCKDSISVFTDMEIPVRGYETIVKMPEFSKSYVRKLVSAFSIVLFERIDQAGLSENEIDKITDGFNEFLVILKLVQDEDNQCQQNLSNYYMSKFKNNLLRYNLTVN